MKHGLMICAALVAIASTAGLARAGNVSISGLTNVRIVHGQAEPMSGAIYGIDVRVVHEPRLPVRFVREAPMRCDRIVYGPNGEAKHLNFWSTERQGCALLPFFFPTVPGS